LRPYFLREVLAFGLQDCDAAAGDMTVHNADCAEGVNISIGEAAEPDIVMTCDEREIRGEASGPRTRGPWDQRAVGVLSGAGSYKPGLMLDKQESQGTGNSLL
jgi:hypothetical protein